MPPVYKAYSTDPYNSMCMPTYISHRPSKYLGSVSIKVDIRKSKLLLNDDFDMVATAYFFALSELCELNADNDPHGNKIEYCG